MKVKDIIIVFSSIICLFVFMIFMFTNHIKNQELQIVKKQIYYDSILVVEQAELKKKDSLIVSQQEMIKNLVRGHANQIYSINKKVKNLEENGK